MFIKPRLSTLIFSLVICLHISPTSFYDYLDFNERSSEKPFWDTIIGFLSTTEGITLGNYVGHGTYGVVLKGSRTFKEVQENTLERTVTVDKAYDMGFKLMKIDKESECFDMDVAKKIIEDGAKFTLGLFYRRAFVFENPGTPAKEYFCVLGLELGTQSLNEKFFSSKDHDIKRDTHTFIEVVFKILWGFKTLNFDARYLHADVKPQNLVLVNNQGILEPRIIDFDFTFQPHKKLDSNRQRMPKWIVYTISHRPNEIKQFCPNNNCSQSEQTRYFSEYKFDTLYREDAYAVGVSLEQIYELNKNYIFTANPIITALKTFIIPKMKQSDPKKRWSTYEAFAEMQYILEENNFELRPIPNQRTLDELLARTELKRTATLEYPEELKPKVLEVRLEEPVAKIQKAQLDKPHTRASLNPTHRHIADNLVSRDKYKPAHDLTKNGVNKLVSKRTSDAHNKLPNVSLKSSGGGFSTQNGVIQENRESYPSTRNGVGQKGKKYMIL